MLQAQNPGSRTQKVAHVSEGVESDQVSSEHPLEQSDPPGKRTKDLVGGEGDVKEKPNRKIGKYFSQHPWDQHQLVVVDPDNVSFLQSFSNYFAEFRIDRQVRFPKFITIRSVLREVVEMGPNGFVAKPFVKQFDLLLSEKNRDHLILAELLFYVCLLLFIFNRFTRPTNPNLVQGLIQGVEASSEPTCAWVVNKLTFFAVDGNREAIGNNDYPCHMCA